MKGKQQGTGSYRFWLLAPAAFVTVFVGHMLYLLYLTSTLQKDWADSFNPSTNFWQSYLASQDYFVSFSYALSASFAVWATARFVYSRRPSAAVGAFGGFSLVTFLAAAGCFLVGCCGSPMLPIYISIFGSQAAGVGKPLMALISLVSIGIGYLYVVRRTVCHCADPETCPLPEQSSTPSSRQNSSPVQTEWDQKQIG